MNFRRLIENGSYNKDMLTPEQKQFVNGMEQSIEEMECCIANLYEKEENESTLEKIRRELAEEVLKNIKDWMGEKICEMIVRLAYENEE